MSYIDIAIVVPLLYAIVKGFSNGVIKEITGLLGFVFGIYFAIHFSVYLEPKISKYFLGYEQFIPISTFIVLFIISILSIRGIGYMLEKITQFLALGMLSKLLGAVFGFLKVLILFCFLISIAKDYKFLKIKQHKNSVLIEPIDNFAQKIMPNINQHKDEVLEKIEDGKNRAKEKIKF